MNPKTAEDRIGSRTSGVLGPLFDGANPNTSAISVTLSTGAHSTPAPEVNKWRSLANKPRGAKAARVPSRAPSGAILEAPPSLRESHRHQRPVSGEAVLRRAAVPCDGKTVHDAACSGRSLARPRTTAAPCPAMAAAAGPCRRSFGSCAGLATEPARADEAEDRTAGIQSPSIATSLPYQGDPGGIRKALSGHGINRAGDPRDVARAGSPLPDMNRVIVVRADSITSNRHMG
jgi:hypothetical protein